MGLAREVTTTDQRAPEALPVGAFGRLSPYERLLEHRIVFLRGALEETTADEVVGTTPHQPAHSPQEAHA